jgi:hypothetical protein
VSNRVEVSDGFCAAWVLQWATEEASRAASESIKADIDERMRVLAESEWDKVTPVPFLREV